VSAVLEAIGLQKRFGGVVAVDGVDLEVADRGITGLIGPNGSGKTTTFSMIAGTLKADAGRILLRGEDITKARSYEVAKRGLVRTFQMNRVFPQMTVFENLTMRLGARRTVADDGLWKLVELVGLEEKLLHFAGELSYGQQKLLELVRAAAMKPTLLLLDEPFAGVNETMEQRLVDVIRYLRDEHGTSFFLIDHEMKLVMELCDHIYVLANGSLICSGNPAHVQNDARTMEAYFGKGRLAGP
jgi:ABC-type branched-subunit amino acid transport system ATPase component